MKAKINDQIQTLVDLQAEFSDSTIPAGAIGTVIECYTSPEEGYAVDIVIPNQTLMGGADYENVILHPDQFRVIPESKRVFPRKINLSGAVAAVARSKALHKQSLEVES
ncbi:MAG: hypothetical protein KME10_02155 [Plectolyngbya sp. WJT66-NPBG17]|jgi:hypothetical protein|nr:hypothetical protein [Plectolyngbya sp. WJT66-NPBG17]MBW4523983.1 hypothetical protein [Phormidium tanganyikae FI6-MK23]